MELATDSQHSFPKMAEGIGGVRYEMATGRELIRSVDPAYDFIDPWYGTMDMKGPLVDKRGKIYPIPDDRVVGLAESVIEEGISSIKLIVADTYGMSQRQIEMFEQILRDRYIYSKPLIILK